MEEPNYTYKTLFKLTSLFPKNNFIIIMGEDNYASIDNWKENRYIKKYEIIVYPRSKEHSLKNYINGELINISSEEIRKRVRLGKTISHMVPKYVSDKISHCTPDLS